MSDSTRVNVQAPRWPREMLRSGDYVVRANGKPIEVLATPVASFAPFVVDGPVQIEIELIGPAAEAAAADLEPVVRPRRLGVEAGLDDGVVRFDLPGPADVFVELPGLPTLLLFVDGPEEDDAPDRDDPNVMYFGGGVLHEVGVLELEAGRTLYIESGAVVRGLVRAKGAAGVTVRGRGILDGSGQRGVETPYGRQRLCYFESCDHLLVRDLIMIEPPAWTLHLSMCRDAAVEHVRQITHGGGSDGVDVVGCRRVSVRDCFLRNGDDCLVVKAVHPQSPREPGSAPDCGEIVFERCSLMNIGGGNSMEIGHELRCGTVGPVVFRDCDVLCVHGHGAVFSIHNGDAAVVEDVLWENIRVEHHYEQLIDFRVIKSRYSAEEEPGSIRNITLRDIDVTQSKFNPGYSISTIGGYDAAHPVRGIRIENLRYDGERISGPDAPLDLLCRHVEDLTIG